MQVFDLSEVQADYILDMPLRRLTKFSRIELEKEQAELERTIEELDAILGDEQLRWKVVSDELAEVAKTYGTPRRTVLLESAGTLGHRGRHAPRGGRRPLLRLPLLERPAGPVSPPTRARARAVSPRANHDVVVSVVRTTARGEVGVLTSRGRVHQARRARPAGAARRPPTTPTSRAGCRSARCCRCEPGERVLALTALRHRRAGPGARHPPGRGQAGQPRGARQPRRVGGDLARRTATRWSARSTWPPATRRCASSPPTPSCCTSAPTTCGRRAGPAAASPASGSPPGERVAWFGALDPRDSVVVTASGLVHRPARHRAGRAQGHAVRRVPRQGPRHRRRPLPPLPQGRGHPGLRLGRRRTRPGRRGQRSARRPARGDRQAGRLRHAREPADRGLRGAGRRAPRPCSPV